MLYLLRRAVAPRLMKKVLHCCIGLRLGDEDLGVYGCILYATAAAFQKIRDRDEDGCEQ
jgi:hypothetical protein